MMRLTQEVPRRYGEVYGGGTTGQPVGGSVTVLADRKAAAVEDTGYSWLEDYLERLDDVEEFREFRARLPWAVG